MEHPKKKSEVVNLTGFDIVHGLRGYNTTFGLVMVFFFGGRHPKGNDVALPTDSHTSV